MITYIDKEGLPLKSYSEIEDWKCVAKTAKVVDTEGNTTLEKFYLKLGSGTLIDAKNKSLYELKNQRSVTYKQVTQQVYDTYIKYLKSTTKVSLRSIERLLEG